MSGSGSHPAPPAVPRNPPPPAPAPAPASASPGVAPPASPYSSPPQKDPTVARASASAAQLKSMHERLEKVSVELATRLGADDLAALNACVTELKAMCGEERSN